MSRRNVRLGFLCLSLIFCATATGTAAGRESAPDQGRPSLVRDLALVPEGARNWAASRLIALLLGRGHRVEMKCSAGIDPNGQPCAMPSSGCRCEP